MTTSYRINELQYEADEFREAMGFPIHSVEAGSKEDRLQISLIEEEHAELIEAWEEEFTDGAGPVLKELADLVYVCFQLASARGWDLSTALLRVHESNMSKLVDGKPLKNEDGKVLKGPNYQPPTLSDLV
jgi:predicted HAD superfamily Cof-like phosphohydrolase